MSLSAESEIPICVNKRRKGEFNSRSEGKRKTLAGGFPNKTNGKKISLKENIKWKATRENLYSF